MISILPASPLALADPDPIVCQLIVFNVGYFHEDIHPVDKRSADAVLITGYQAGGTGAGVIGITEITAGTGIHSTYQLEISRER